MALVVVIGCGEPVQEYGAVVTGTVTIDGELATSGTVTFHPVKAGNLAIGRIHPDGSYSLRTGQGDLRSVDGGTVAPGEYIVTVSITGPPEPGSQIAEGGPPIPGPLLVAAKYARKETSDLTHTVHAGNQLIILELAGAEATPSEEGSSEIAAGEQTSAPADAGSGTDRGAAEAGQSTPAETAPAVEPAAGESAVEQNLENPAK